MQLRKSNRRKTKIKLAIQGPSGSGKTYSSLLLAKGLANNNLSKVTVIDTENGSADLYSHLGNYNVVVLSAPYTPEKYIEAIELCEKSGSEVIIIDSISHCWDYLLQYHSNLTGTNSFKNWGKVTPRQNQFINKILHSDTHIICTMRTKQGYVINNVDGKFTLQKIGLRPIQRNDIEFEFTTVLNIDLNHNSTISKDRTSQFKERSKFIISADTGTKILEWCNNPISIDDIANQINSCINIKQLNLLYAKHPGLHKLLDPVFEQKKSMLLNLTNFNNLN